MATALEEEPLVVWSTFSGVGGIDLGLERAGMRVALQAESDPWCRAVLAHHWPDVPCAADVCDVAQGDEGRSAARIRALGGGRSDQHPDDRGGGAAGRHAGGRHAADAPAPGLDQPRRPDVLCGGFPCQDVSVAGKRRGLDGERSGLFFEFARIAEAVRPRWVLLENVPGLLTSNSGRDFGVVLGTLAELGYGLAWRVLDSRYFGVPQRRRRVFIVGHIGGDDGPALRALCEGCEGGAEARECSWSTPPPGSRDSAAPHGQGAHYYIEDGENGTLKAGGAAGSPPRTDRLPLLVTPGRQAATLSSGAHPNSAIPGRRQEDDYNLVVAPTLQARHRDGGGYGPEMPMIPTHGEPVAINLRGREEGNVPEVDPDGLASVRSSSGGSSRTLVATSGEQAHALTAHHNRNQADHDTLVAAYAITPEYGQGSDLRADPIDQAGALDATAEARSSERGVRVASTSGVRRLTPRECERLQAFPDDWTLVDGLKCPDSRRYGAMGNAVTVSVAEWIGRGIVTEHRRVGGKVGPSAAWG